MLVSLLLIGLNDESNDIRQKCMDLLEKSGESIMELEGDGE